ncbi:hypothetical protein K440DRAFT_661101 [Wilcoxina mikolae CBS 423.85]|nr:hypothetical protein K440DRAFT_661101 [Wilcoxina mikolae CBS 423.85]
MDRRYSRALYQVLSYLSPRDLYACLLLNRRCYVLTLPSVYANISLTALQRNDERLSALNCSLARNPTLLSYIRTIQILYDGHHRQVGSADRGLCQLLAKDQAPGAVPKGLNSKRSSTQHFLALRTVLQRAENLQRLKLACEPQDYFDWSFFSSLPGPITQLSLSGYIPAALSSNLRALILLRIPGLSIADIWKFFVNAECRSSSPFLEVLTISHTTNIRTLKVDICTGSSSYSILFPKRFLQSVFKSTPHLEDLTVHSLSGVELQVLLENCKNITAIRWLSSREAPLTSDQLITLLSSDTLHTLAHPYDEFKFNWRILNILNRCPKLIEWRLLRTRYETDYFLTPFRGGDLEQYLECLETFWYKFCWKQEGHNVQRQERKKRGFYNRCVSYQEWLPHRKRPLGRCVSDQAGFPQRRSLEKESSDVYWLGNFKVDVEEARKWIIT